MIMVIKFDYYLGFNLIIDIKKLEIKMYNIL